MELNIINYILNKKKISQNELAEMLDPPVSKSILSKWKNGSEQIPPIRAIELRRIARIGKYKDGQNEEWLKIIKNSKTSADGWYESIFEHISFKTQSLYLNGQYGEINYDSVWIENSQSMLITLNRAGVPVKDLNLTFEPTRPVIWDDVFEDDQYPTGTSVYTDADNLLIPYIRAYSALRHWVMYNVSYINDKSISDLQFDFIQKIPEIALFHVDKELFKAVDTDMDALDKLIEKSRTDALKLILQFSKNVPSNGVEYLNFLNSDLKEIDRETVKSPEYQREYGLEDSKFFSKDSVEEKINAINSEQKILDGIKNNEKLLKEILEKLNNLTNK
jgi:hypothetical protein